MANIGTPTIEGGAEGEGEVPKVPDVLEVEERGEGEGEGGGGDLWSDRKVRQEFADAMHEIGIASNHEHRSREEYRQYFLLAIWDTMFRYDDPLTLGYATGEWLERQIEEVESIDDQRRNKRRKVAAREKKQQPRRSTSDAMGLSGERGES